ncbi:TonB-dependent receptor domain-containing protein [Sphingomonas fuzhouensis]|uniref:TonB-dependent receptor domain-containing protein n=1 Tax=Sphingomonas fuzhouensis TaxID=3106033 RepID=UPI002AFE200F|nr:TonB-dependent receptor [Sphingomonas sp. SGZ-02]
MSDDGDTPSEGEQIVVTGTRLQRPNFTSNSPLTVVDATEIRYQGAIQVENVLNRLPQVTPDSNENGSNGSDGTARVNLRNLGSNRNLVLINGQRMLPVQANDLNFIPAALIKRVDVVTGGASAVYGSDAISGVVNFILRDDLNGVRTDVQYGFAQHQNDNAFARSVQRQANYRLAQPMILDGQKLDVNVAFGTNFPDNRGNVTAYFGYRDTKPILQGDRDVSACAFDPAGAGNATLTCGGSSNNQYGLFDPITGPNADTGAFNNTRDGNRTWVPYDSSFRYNYAPLNYFQRNDTRYTAGAFAKYEISPAIEAYGSVMFMDDHTNSQVAPSALFQGYTYSINCDNPFLSAQQGQILCGSAYGTSATQQAYIGYRPVAGNARPRRDDLRHTDYRVSGGIRGQIAEGIRYDANALFSTVLYNETYENDIDPSRANRGIQVVNVNGTPTCKSVIDGSDPQCVPLDIFRYNGISDAAFSYIYAPTSTRGVDRETVLSGNISADLGTYGVKSPWSDDGIGVVLGVEHRYESLEFKADALALQKGTKETQGRFDVNEVFAEIEVPIIQNRPFFKELALNAGYRGSDYSNLSKIVSTYKAELSWAPSSDIRLRGSYNRAIRAANVSELFGPQFNGNVSAQDPCATATPTATFAQCARTGVTQAQYGRITDCPAETCTAQFGGNPALKPETADTLTAGIVFTPTFLRRLSLTVDYFDIKVRDYISSISVPQTISQCIATGNPFFCNLFKRDPRGGIIFGDQGYIVSTTQNTGSLRTSGVDFGLSYLQPLGGAGSLAVDFQGTWNRKLVNEPVPGLGSFDCVGYFGPTCGQPMPEWRHQSRFTWTDAAKVGSISLNWRYIGPTKLTNNSTDPNFANTPSIFNSRIKAYNYFDLAGTAKVQDGIVFRAGVNNLFDRDPPIIAQGLLAAFGNGNTYPGMYDAVGRTVFIGLTAEF